MIHEIFGSDIENAYAGSKIFVIGHTSVIGHSWRFRMSRNDGWEARAQPKGLFTH